MDPRAPAPGQAPQVRLLITDPDHPRFGQRATLVPVEAEPEVRLVELEDGSRTTLVAGQFRWEWRDLTD